MSPASTSLEPTANAANGVVKLPLVTTAPLASVKVIEPTDVGSGSQPGVTDAASPMPATVQTRGTTTNGATIAARITRRVPCHPCDRRRVVCCHHCRALCTATLTSHPKRQSARRSSSAKSLGQLPKQASPRTRTPDARKVNERNSATCRADRRRALTSSPVASASVSARPEDRQRWGVDDLERLNAVSTASRNDESPTRPRHQHEHEPAP